MNRRSFLKGLGILAGASLIPDWFGKKNPAEPEEYPIKLGKGLEWEIDNNTPKYIAGIDVAKNTAECTVFWAYESDESGTVKWYSMNEIIEKERLNNKT